MFIVALLSWWYGAGWRRQANLALQSLASAVDYFSISLLLKTLFAPFRQISAGQVSGPIGVRWRAFVDRLVSRCIGAIVRMGLIIIGSVALIAFSLGGVLRLALWAVIPALPIVGLVLMIIGWTPSWT